MRGSYIWAGVMTIVVVGWMAKGNIIIGGSGDVETAETQTVAAASAAKLERVRVRTFVAEDRRASLLARGRTEAPDRVHAVAETAGLVAELPVDKGQWISAGDLLCRIEPGSRAAEMQMNLGALAQAKRNFEATQKLVDRGFATATKLSADQAAYDAAKAHIAQMELDLDRLNVRASFDGVVENIPVEVGTHLMVGGECATVVAMDPMRVVAQISERDISALEIGMVGTVSLVTGETEAGTVKFISPTAEPTTRTFRVELEISNPDHRIRDGVTAELHMTLAAERAHLLPPSLLTLNDEGIIGVRGLDGEDMVVFYPLNIVADGKDGVWVDGLPDTATIITVGQEYVVAGQKVEPVLETAEARS